MGKKPSIFVLKSDHGYRVPGRVRSITYLGKSSHIRVEAAGADLLIEDHGIRASTLKPGDSVELAVDPARVLVLPHH